MSDYELGARVRFDRRLYRVTEYRGGEQRFGRGERWKIWRSFDTQAVDGIVVGKRSLANGRAEYEYEAGMVWYPGTAEHFTAYLIAFDLHKRPVYVLPDDIRRRPPTISREAHEEGQA